MNMNTLINVLAFVLANYGGTWAITFAYVAGTRMLNVVDVFAEGFDEAALFQSYLLQTYVTLFICGLFSFSFFFLKNYWRYVFLMAPLVLPAAYGLFFLINHTA